MAAATTTTSHTSITGTSNEYVTTICYFEQLFILPLYSLNLMLFLLLVYLIRRHWLFNAHQRHATTTTTRAARHNSAQQLWRRKPKTLKKIRTLILVNFSADCFMRRPRRQCLRLRVHRRRHHHHQRGYSHQQMQENEAPGWLSTLV